MQWKATKETWNYSLNSEKVLFESYENFSWGMIFGSNEWDQNEGLKLTSWEEVYGHFYQNILVHLLLKIKKSEHELQEAALWIHDEWWNKTLTRINMLLWKLKMEITSRGKKTQTQNPVKVRRQKAVQTSDVIINELAKESCLFNTKDTVSLTDKVFTLCAHQEYFQICYSSFPDLSLHKESSCTVGWFLAWPHSGAEVSCIHIEKCELSAIPEPSGYTICTPVYFRRRKAELSSCHKL